MKIIMTGKVTTFHASKGVWPAQVRRQSNVPQNSKLGNLKTRVTNIRIILFQHFENNFLSFHSPEFRICVTLEISIPMWVVLVFLARLDIVLCCWDVLEFVFRSRIRLSLIRFGRVSQTLKSPAKRKEKKWRRRWWRGRPTAIKSVRTVTGGGAAAAACLTRALNKHRCYK